MKATELMIGDLIFINNTPHKIQVIDSIDAEILADDELYYVGEDRCHSEDKIEGILITPEILKKNGWKHRALFVDMEVDKNIKFSWTDMFGVSLYHNGHYMCDCKYIHTLQHALRLCGLNELADNFKV